MEQQKIYSGYDPERLLDSLKERLGLESDKALAQKLNISPKLLNKIRSRDLTISPSMLLWMGECVQTSSEELRGILGDRRARLRPAYKIAA